LYDLRATSSEDHRIGLDRSGFQALHRVNIQTKDFDNDADIRKQYYPEIVE
jgi:hypothetical protein